jgi:adenylate cyclase
LSGWTGDLAASGWRKVVSSIADLVGGATPAPAPSVQSERAGVSICVLPFANMSNDADQEYFSDGISEDIITDLSKVSALAVVARNTAFTFKAKSVDIKHVARQLSVSHVLEGSVRKSGNRVRITAQLIDGSTGNQVWAERYDRDLSNIFSLQCPSADNLRLLSRFRNGGSGSSGLEFMQPAADAASCDWRVSDV